MAISKLSLFSFRNHEKKEITFSKGITVIWGENGSGKTSLLEAIYILSLGKSFKTHKQSSIIKKGHTSYILKGDFCDGYPMQEAYKDLINGAKISADRKIPAPVLAAATSTYKQALLEGHGDKDKGGMIMVYERLLGVSFRYLPCHFGSLFSVNAN